MKTTKTTGDAGFHKLVFNGRYIVLDESTTTAKLVFRKKQPKKNQYLLDMRYKCNKAY